MIELLPHQREDGERMAAGGNALNWSGMGAGKTLASLNAFGVGGFERGLVVAPPIALTMWSEVITEFLGMSCQVLRTGAQKIKGEPDFIVTSYTLASGGQQEQLDNYFYTNLAQALIIDEAHYIKSPGAKRTTALLGPKSDGERGLWELFDVGWQLTGTPITRYYDDLYTQLRSSHPHVLAAYGLDSYEKWVLTFTRRQLKQYHPRQRPKMEVVGNQNSELLNSILEECVVIRRTLKEVAEALPPITYRRVDIDNADTRRLARILDNAEQLIEAGLLNGDPLMVEEWQKLYHAREKEVAEYIKESATNAPVLVGHWFRSTAGGLVQRLRGSKLTIAEVNGSTSPAARDNIRHRFNEGKIDVLFGQIEAMSTSWNIQSGSSHVIMAEDHFSPGTVDQFIHRVYRIGQKDHVQVDFIKSMHPIDDALTRVRTRKQEGIDKVL